MSSKDKSATAARTRIAITTNAKAIYTCNKGCGNEIYFDANNISQSGKYIPLDKQTGLPHQCQQ